MKGYMKKILFFPIIITMACWLWSCNDVLDMAPDGKITLEEVFNDPDKVGAFLNSCYNNIPQKNIGYYFFEAFVVGMSDDAWSAADREGQQIQAMYDGTAASASYHPLRDNNDSHGSGNNQYWTRYWTQIRLCTQFIEHIDDANVRTEAERRRWKAEAQVMRAFFYHELVKWFGKLPIIDRTYAFDEDFSHLTREPVYDVVKFIIEDCDAGLACAELPWRITADAEAPRATKALAWALKSKMLLFAASPLFNEGQNHWQEAYEANKSAVEQLKANGYELYTTCVNTARYGTGPEAAYHELATTAMAYSSDPVDKETIFQHRGGTYFSWHVNYIGRGPNMFKAGTCPTQELVDAYEVTDGTVSYPVLDLAKPYADDLHLRPNFNPDAAGLYSESDPYVNRDPRFYATVVYNGTVVQIHGADYPVDIYDGSDFRIDTDQEGKFTRTGYYHRKMVVPGAGGDIAIDNAPWKHFRLAEIILNYAEAACEVGRLDEAREAVNEIRARVSMPPLPTGLSQDELRLRIRNERRVELAFEETRYFDLRRWTAPDGDLSETCRWFTAMHITKNADGTFSYERKQVRSTQRYGYQNKDLLLPIDLAEVSRIESLSGQNWQNPGW